MTTTTDTSHLRGQLAERAASTELVANGDRKPPTIVDLINWQRSEIARALPKHMDADRLARIATTVIKATPKLLECTSASLLGALMLSAQTGMEPGPLGHAYLVPRKIKGTWECQWMLGYKGIIELARRSGKLVSIEAREVCERDDFDYAYGLHERLEHRPYMDGDRGPIVAFWGLAKFTDGGHYFLVMSKADVDKARERSDAYKQGFGPWVSDYAAMGRKTVIRRMAPFLPLSAEQAGAIAYDEQVNTRVAAGLVDEPPEAQWIDVVADRPALAPVPDSGPVDESPVGDVDDPFVGLPDVDGRPQQAAPDEPGGFFPEAPDPVDTGEAITDAQNRALHRLLKAVYNAEGAQRHELLTDLLGREITSAKQLTKMEASRLIDELQAVHDDTDGAA